MKIVFVYFDFTNIEKYPEGYHGFHQCGLNFSTDYTYSLIRQGNISQISRVPRPANQIIESGFWTDPRIYNVTAIVGDNGVGKTTLLHSLLRSCLMNSKVDFDFAILIESSQSIAKGSLLLYSNMDCKFIMSNLEIKQTDTYPEELMKTKFMLLDNTLTFSSIELVNEFEKEYIEYQQSNYGYYQIPTQTEKHQKQFFNESLISSLCYSNYISTFRIRSHTQEITKQIATHFRYETYQEFRYVFDKHQRNTLIELKNDGYNVPIPKHLTVSVFPPDFNYHKHLIECFDTYNSQHTIGLSNKNVPEINMDVLERIEFENRGNIVHNLGINSLINYLFYISHHQPPMQLVQELENFNSFSKEAYINFINKCPVKVSESTAEIYLKNTISFVEFITEKEHLFHNIFTSIGELKYIVDINEDIDAFMIDFINKYRAVCGNHYFLTFSWGMSGGESNLLRMFTKFRYLLYGPPYYEEDDDNVRNVVVNKFSDKNEKICDSLVILIDEADLSYHPEWQRSFIALLTAFLPKLYKDPYYEGAEEGCKNIQIILTTHSPLILGDFPMASVIYLTKANGAVQIEKSASINPFGQNLYTILKDGFYLKRTMGELAHLKLNEVIVGLRCIQNKVDEYKSLSDEHVSDMLEKLKRYQKTINHLPDGIIREKIQQEIDDCRHKINHANMPMLLRRKEELMNELADVENAIKEQEGGND